MAFTATPTGYFASWAEDGTTITVPIASIPGLTATTADGTTGNIREILYRILDQAFAKWSTLSDANRATKMVIRKDSETLTSGNIKHTFTLAFETAASGQAVVAE